MADQVADAELDLARLTDGLRAEREQGITIDVAYRHFSTPRRRFIIADTPGHAQYTRNMVTGASTADVAVVLVDAREGLLTAEPPPRGDRGAARIPRIVLAVNKMDLVGYDADRFRRDLRRLPRVGGAARRRGDHLHPDLGAAGRQRRRALGGDGLVPRADAARSSSRRARWRPARRRRAAAAAGPVRDPLRRAARLRRPAAPAARVRPGDEVVVLPSGLATRVSGRGGPRRAAASRRARRCRWRCALEDELDVGRGALICAPGRAARSLDARHRGDGVLDGRVARPAGRPLRAQAHDAHERARARRPCTRRSTSTRSTPTAAATRSSSTTSAA